MENISYSPEFKHKHGLSLYIETSKHKILFDVGPNEYFIENARLLGVDLTQIDLVIISHGHSDHTGGLNTFMELNKTAKVYIHERSFDKHYSRKDGKYHSVGLKLYKRYMNRVIMTNDYYQIDDELILFSKVTGRKYFTESNSSLYQKIGGKFVKDNFDHEQNLVIKEDSKTVMFSGCCHNGIINTLNRAKELGIVPTHIISGLHLFSPSSGKSDKDEIIFGIANDLKRQEGILYTCHCTGYENYEKMKMVLGKQIDYLSCGKVLKLI